MSGVTNEHRFAQIPEALIYDHSIDPLALRVYCVLMRHGQDPNSCYPSHARIAKLIGVSDRSVARPLKDLANAGWITRQYRHSDQGRTSDGYYVRATPAPPAERKEIRRAPERATDDQYRAEERATVRAEARATPHAEERGEREPVEREPVERESASTSSSLPVPSRPVPKGVDPADVEGLCQHLAARVARHRGTAPKVTPAWQADMGTLLNSGASGWDGPPPTPDQVLTVVDAVFDRLNVRSTRGFCWADQVRSPQGLRGKWEQLTFALREHQQAHPEAADVLAAMDMLDKMGVKR